MIGNGYCDERVIEFLIQCMAAHCSIAICGCSGSGKTELLKYLTQYIKTAERAVTIEDVLEIHYQKMNPNKDCMEEKKETQIDFVIAWVDHGNADEMYELDKKIGTFKKNADGSPKAKTSHTLNPVPCIIYDNFTENKYTVKPQADFGLANVAATTVNLLGYEAPSMWKESLIDVK